MKKVISKNGNLLFHVDGKEVAPIAYMSYLPMRADYAIFRKMGYELFSACIYMGDMPINEIAGAPPFDEGIWKDRKTFDFSVLDRVIKQTLGDTPTGHLLLRINVNVPCWWRKENPDELVKLSNGKTLMQSSFSEKWIEDVQLFFTKLKAHIDDSAYNKNVIAWQIAAMNTEEWIAPIDGGEEPDFSECAQKAFSRWCVQKYKDISSLNVAWGTKLCDFSQVEIPSMQQRQARNQTEIVEVTKHAQTIDFYRCFNCSYATAIERLSAYVKQLFQGDIFVGTFYGYIGQLGCNSGHCALQELIHSKHIDFFASPFTYTAARKTPNDWFYHSAMQACKKAGKLWFLEADVRTCNTKSLYECMSVTAEQKHERMFLPVWFGPTTEEESVWHLIRSFGKVLASGNAFWWFDMWGGWYRSPQILAFMAKARATYIATQDYPFRSVSEVAVVLDQDATYGMNIRYGGQACYQQLVWLGDVGVPYDLYLKGDVSASDLKDYKCVLYLAPLEITLQDAVLIAQLAERGTTVVLTGKKYALQGKNVCVVEKILTEEELRAYYQKAGVHIYLDKTGLLFANERFVCITAAEDGEYTLCMPHDCVLRAVFDDEQTETVECTTRLSMKKNQSKLFSIENNACKLQKRNLMLNEGKK